MRVALLASRGLFGVLSGELKIPHSRSASQSASGIPAFTTNLLNGDIVSVAQVDGAGRGLVASQNIAFGAEVHAESPYVCHAVPSRLSEVCCHCLAVLLAAGSSPLRVGQRLRFCSPACLQSAEASYLEAELDGCFQELEAHCQKTGERFPLLAKRLACRVLAGAAQPEELEFLAFARLPRPPPPRWLHCHALLQRGLQAWAAGDCAPQQPDRLARLGLEWYLGLLARLHINTFRVDCVFPPPPGGLAAAAAAAIGGGGGSVGGSFSGSALYAAASLFNHSCDPNTGVDFPANDSGVVFSALRPIAAGEQLCISYIDATAPAAQRRQQLLWNYG